MERSRECEEYIMIILKRVGLFLAVATAAQWPAGAAGQITYDGCVNRLGVPVISVASNHLQNVAMARETPYGPEILYNPNVLNSLQPVTRLFWYAHECAHHDLGHVLGNLILSREVDADCWAIRTLSSAGLISRPDLSVIQGDIFPLPGDGWLYLPGPERALLLEECFVDGQASLSQALLPPPPPPSFICQAPMFWCRMATSGVVGTSCVCLSAFGRVNGVIVSG